MPLTNISTFQLTDLARVGESLDRPECVLATEDGSVYTGDWTLGVARVAPDGSTDSALSADIVAQGFRPNGIAMTPNGDFLFANMSRAGGVWRIGPHDSKPRPVAVDIEGDPIGRTNFVLLDGDRTWITVSSKSRKHDTFTADSDSGQILLVQDGQVTVAADGLNWTNELRISPDSKYLYVNETFACRTTRYDLGADGTLSNPVRINYPGDTFPDGMAFDSEGALWIACVISNRVIRVAPDHSWTVLFEDLGEQDLAGIATSHAAGELTWDRISASRGEQLSNLSSIAFGGLGRKTVFLGGLGFNEVRVLDSPVAGAPMAHHQQ